MMGSTENRERAAQRSAAPTQNRLRRFPPPANGGRRENIERKPAFSADGRSPKVGRNSQALLAKATSQKSYKRT
jgi:hypothetical protein